MNSLILFPSPMSIWHLNKKIQPVRGDDDHPHLTLVNPFIPFFPLKIKSKEKKIQKKKIKTLIAFGFIPKLNNVLCCTALKIPKMILQILANKCEVKYKI